MVITNIGVILHHNLKTKDMKKVLWYLFNLICLGLSCFNLEHNESSWLSLFIIIISSINILVILLNNKLWIK